MQNPIPRLQSRDPSEPKALRLWPGIAIVAVQWLLWFVLPRLDLGDAALMLGVLGGLAAGPAVLVWWAFFSRAPGIDRFGGALLMILAWVAGHAILDESIRTGNLGLMFLLHAVPVSCLAFVSWAAVLGRMPAVPRRATMASTILLAAAAWGLLRSDGLTGSGAAMFNWRWAPTDESALLAREAEEPLTAPTEPDLAPTAADWPAFRGAGRDGVVRGTHIGTDWASSPPVELWRRPAGPGCSSFAVQGNLAFTQEQRGEEELVTCFHVETGKPAWRHADAARFWDSHAGAGPRATPTVHEGRVYALGGTGILNALDARTGAKLWSRDAAADAGTRIPNWGFCASPLVVDDLVVVAVEGTVAAYDRAAGEPRWKGPDGGSSYSSPHLVTLGGVVQIVHMSNAGATSLSPADGKTLWQIPWTAGDRVVQPALTADGDLLLCGGGTTFCMRRYGIAGGEGGWRAVERWESTGLKPNHNDSVVHEGFVYGFTGPRLACISVADGSRSWRGAPYGGFTLLLADQDLLLVLTEKGEVALVEAVNDRFHELGRFQAVEGKTWNHPALARDILLVRNSREMAAFRLPPARG